MNEDSFADAGRRIARTNERVFGLDRSGRATTEHIASLAARFLWYLTIGVALAWVVAFVVPAFSGLLAATMVGFGLLWLVPWLVVIGVVQVLEATE